MKKAIDIIGINLEMSDLKMSNRKKVHNINYLLRTSRICIEAQFTKTNVPCFKTCTIFKFLLSTFVSKKVRAYMAENFFMYVLGTFYVVILTFTWWKSKILTVVASVQPLMSRASQASFVSHSLLKMKKILIVQIIFSFTR